MDPERQAHIEHADALDEIIVGLHNDLFAAEAERDRLRAVVEDVRFTLLGAQQKLNAALHMSEGALDERGGVTEGESD